MLYNHINGSKYSLKIFYNHDYANLPIGYYAKPPNVKLIMGKSQLFKNENYKI